MVEAMLHYSASFRVSSEIFDSYFGPNGSPNPVCWPKCVIGCTPIVDAYNNIQLILSVDETKLPASEMNRQIYLEALIVKLYGNNGQKLRVVPIKFIEAKNIPSSKPEF
ncbi:MAG TPA: hypothetical protein VJ343_02635 [archaeon]|nr:hypothetical protein [archaeon]